MVRQKQENKADKAGLTAIKKLHQNIKKIIQYFKKPNNPLTAKSILNWHLLKMRIVSYKRYKLSEQHLN